MSSTYDPMVGTVLDGRYEILSKLARGGMATVYRAHDNRLERTVAVKLMRTDLGEDEDSIAKFDREARSAALLSHPAVVGIFDQGSANGKPYIVMEFVEGETLRSLIRREGPLPPAIALEILEPITEALTASHDAGVVHRDIKPENVLISPQGQIKVADFGLARQVSAPQMTATGVLVGTASYLSPELVTHSRPDSRSDIYSAGVVAFELLTGEKPHVGENNYQIAYRHVNVDVDPPSKRLRNPGWKIPDYVDAFVQACTVRDPENRISDGREMLQALRLVRQQLAKDPELDCPELAGRLRPAASDATVTKQIQPNQQPRPRPVASADAAATMVTPHSSEQAREEIEIWRPVAPTATATLSPPSSTPISPRSEDSGRQPRLSRTPVFPNLHISQSPVHRRRRGIIALVGVLLLTVGVGFGSWWWMSGRYTTVPSVAMQSEAEAIAAAKANELETESSTEYSEEVSAGLVIGTKPEAGSRMLRGQVLVLRISLGPERYPMPKVVGLTKDAASKALTDSNLKVGKVTEAWSETVETGMVIEASKKEGEKLKPETTVDLTISKGREPLNITDFTNQEAAAAERSLTDAGFKVEVTEETSDTVAAGLVISQSPNNGTGNRGDVIKLVKSKGPSEVEIPAVRYQRVEQAKLALESLGLVVEVKDTSRFPTSLNIASETDPPAGTKVPKGTKVTLFIT